MLRMSCLCLSVCNTNYIMRHSVTSHTFINWNKMSAKVEPDKSESKGTIFRKKYDFFNATFKVSKTIDQSKKKDFYIVNFSLIKIKPHYQWSR